MKKNYLFKFSIALLVLFSAIGNSQNYVPINVSGFNFDGIAEATPALNTTTGSLDGSNNVLYSRAYGVATTFGAGLNDSRFYTVGNLNYLLQPYNANNLLSLTAGQSGTLTFMSPFSYNSISVLGFGSEGSAPFTYTINFADGTTATGSGTFSDWFYNPGAVITGHGRVNRSDTGVITGSDPRIYKQDITLSAANKFKKINSITFAALSFGSQRLNIMAVSGVMNVANDADQCGAVVNYPTPTFDVAKPKLLLLFHDTLIVGEVNDVKAKLTATSQFNVVDVLDLSVTTPTVATLRQYDAILAWNNNVSGNPAGDGDVLADYIDLGGGVADAIFENAADNFLGRYNTPDYRVLMPAPQASGTVRSLGTVALPAHPIMSGITTFNAGITSYVSTSTTISPSSYMIARYDNNLPLIAAKENVALSAAKRVSLNFFPPSSAFTSAGWDQSTQGAQIMANALKWVAKRIAVQTAGIPAKSVFPVGTTTNTFEFTDDNNVVHAFSFDVVVNDIQAPVAVAQNITVTLTPAGTVTVAPADVDNGSTDNCGTPTLSLDITTFNCSNVGTNNVILTATDAAGNTATAPAVVTVVSGIVITPSQTDVSCHGESTGEAIANVTAGGGAYTYSWAPSGGTAATAAGLAAGTYTVTVTDANGCTKTQSYTITEPTAPLATTPNTSQINVACNGDNSGSATIAVNGGTAPYSYLWNTGATTDVITNLTAGTYSVTVTDANGCTLANSYIITEPAAPLATTPNTTQVDVLCHGNATGSATIAVDGGTAPYSYLWNTGSTTATITNLTAGAYSVTLTDANGCTLTQNYTITEPAAPLALTPNTSQVDVLCYGNATGSATIAVDGGTAPYSYLWNNGATTDVITNLIAGTYSVTVTDANGCTLANSYTITEPAAPLALTPNTSQVDVLCHGNATGSATIAVDGGTAPYSYLWNNGETTDVITNLIAGTYTVTVTDANGCTLANSYTITEPAAPLATTPNTSQINVACNGGNNGSATIAVNGGTAPYSYLWNTGSTTATITNLTAGAYSVTLTDANGCKLTQNYTITEPAAPLALTPNTSQVDVLCHGNATGSATIAVDGGTAPYSYLWNTGATTDVITNLIAGTYSVTVTDANGCTLTQNYTITEPAAPLATTPNTSQVDVLCHGNSTGSATIAVDGGTAPYSYLWNNGETTDVITNLIAGTYTVTVTDANGCTLANSYTITEPAAPLATTPNTSQINVACNGGNSGSATIAVNGGTAPYSYLWDNGETTNTITGLTAGTYTVDVTDANGCTLSQSFTITEPPVLAASAGTVNNVNCFGAANGSAAVNVTGGTGSYSYSWNTTPVQTTATAVNLGPGTYVVTVKDANLCETIQSITITQPDALTATIDSYVNVLCYNAANGTATVTAAGGTPDYTYSWNTNPVQTTATAVNLVPGNYTVTVTDANGCIKTAAVTITQPAAPLHLTTSQTNVTCYGAFDGSLGVDVTGGTGPYTYTWTPAVSTTNTATGLGVGNYKIVVTDANGCTDLRYLSVTSPLLLTGTIAVTNVGCGGAQNGSAVANITGGTAPYQYLWSNGATTASIENLAGGTYSVSVTDAHNCTFTASTTITEPATIVITSQPQDASVEAGQWVVFSVTAQNATQYQWQVSTNGGTTWANVPNGGASPHYSGGTTAQFSIANITMALNGNLYRVIVSQNGGCTVVSDQASLTVTAPVAAIEDVRKLSMTVYPNPASTNVYIKIPDFDYFENLKVAVYDLNGRMVRNEQPITSDNYQIDVTSLESAVYIITITSDTGRIDKKIVVNKTL